MDAWYLMVLLGVLVGTRRTGRQWHRYDTSQHLRQLQQHLLDPLLSLIRSRGLLGGSTRLRLGLGLQDRAARMFALILSLVRVQLG